MKQKGQIDVIALTKLLIGALCLVQSYAYANECHFGKTGEENGTSTIINGTSSTPVYFIEQLQFDHPNVIEIGGPYEAKLTPSLISKCNLGNDGKWMENITYDSFGEDVAKWPTNIPGIYYAVRVYSNNNPGAWFTTTNGKWASLGVQAPNESNDWKIQIKLYQTQEFSGNLNYSTKITPQASKRIGGMSIGSHTDSNNKPWWFEVTTASFSIPVSASTCQTAMVNNGSNTVDFGEVMASDIRDTSFFPRKYFSLQLRGCNNVTAIQYKVTSKTADGTGAYIPNSLTSSDAATGVVAGFSKIFITNPPNGGDINDPAFVYVPLYGEGGSYVSGTNSSIDLPFEAWMGRDWATPVKPGNYRGIATFTINYL
ncbi:fimbrial protein [Enterobacter hormaechei]|uniref:fimbrial protein n=1 Tax=Enterobacter hormaechei TaxID=158836 RepID=UPI0020B792E7|nr:fimbrial protein [Enterobacter hormaechei]MCP3815920.1 fimbrial protein [Enterobacter hormaechei]MCP3826593.1 fimbrial protein [Enterobacter hormaechei]MCW4626998.1 fimbrial protein [Enterobacter hormaechei]